MNLEFAWHPGAWALLAPVLAVVGTALVLLVGELFVRRVPWTWVAVAGLALAAGLATQQWDRTASDVEAALGGAIRVDNWTVFLQVLMLVCAALSMLASESYTVLLGERRVEFPVLVLFATSGMMLLVASGDLITLFLALELMSFPTYVLCGFLRHNIKSNESALKYFVLGSFASSIFLYGVALIWGSVGSTSLQEIGNTGEGPLYALGAVLLLVGFLFKVGAVPFHMWVPDVYEGAPTPVTMYMATAVKVAAFGAFYRVLTVALLPGSVPIADILWWIACVTMIIGNLCALTQDNVKRLFAFSSVAHAGYVLVGLAAVARLGSGGEAVLFYLLAYAFMNIGAFTVVQLLSRRTEGELQFDRDWSGMARRFPTLGLAMTVFMLALGGIPPTAGFLGKYLVFRSAIDAGLVSLVIIGVLNSAASVYFYLRVVVAMYMREERRPAGGGIAEAYGGTRVHALQGPGAMANELAAHDASAAEEGEDEPPPPRLAERGALAARVVVVVCLVATLWFGFAPNVGGIPGVEQVMAWAREAASSVR